MSDLTFSKISNFSATDLYSCFTPTFVSDPTFSEKGIKPAFSILAMTLAALSATGETLIDDTDRHIDRGYEKFVTKLSNLGADIKEIA